MWQQPAPAPIRSIVYTSPDTIATGAGPGIAAPQGGNVVGMIVNAQGAPSGSPLTFQWAINGVDVDSNPFALGVGVTETTYYPFGSLPDGATQVEIGDILTPRVIAVNGATGPLILQLLIG